MSHSIKNQLSWLTAHLVVALASMVGIGGATRVMEAGLACPDWPLCYGYLLPGPQMNIPVFLEWFHRLDAFLIIVALLILLTQSVLWRHVLPQWLPWISGFMLVLVAFQAGLGALTVLRLLSSDVVTAHLAIALLLVATISACHQGLIFTSNKISANSNRNAYLKPGVKFIPYTISHRWWTYFAALTTIVVYTQCLLGGLMATQRATQLCVQKGTLCRWLYSHEIGGIVTTLCITIFVIVSLINSEWSRNQWPLLSFAILSIVMQILLGTVSMRLVLSAPGVTVAHQITAAILIAVLSALTTRGFLTTSTVLSTRPSPLLGGS
ncbi:Heme A synthase, cytochrome oxidase biogenesis protein Cox15-CtaA (chromatophore) [Paulinella micropora]|uniref:Heme A synthase, cytochrome oxidase biogenesis protein Cox15-CtaA n=1 Tax=Paulinella micropora TaxID=1928728 RepID=A0A1S6YIW5_9EUKA|nr:hypothetical protein PFK_730 [Paulinella micropora]BBL86480.1 Heme A synthase, cytochrome oxidase biogenesis protein Cox15-CtaA [Paulinella micropora]